MSSASVVEKSIKKNKGGRKRTNEEVEHLLDKVYCMMMDEYRAPVIREKLKLTEQEYQIYKKKAEARFIEVTKQRSSVRVGRRVEQIQDLYNMAIEERDRAEARKCWDSASKFELDSQLIEGSPNNLEHSASKFFDAVSTFMKRGEKKKKRDKDGKK